MRLQVFLSHNGISSRRQAMVLIQAGRVKVNEEIVKEPSWAVDPSRDTVQVDGRWVEKKSYQYILLNKPAGYVTTTLDRHAEKIVLDLLPEAFRHLHPVGRLDKETEGLLLLTNDGDAAYYLTHPKFPVDKTYVVRIYSKLTPQQKNLLEKGVLLEGRRTAPAKIRNLIPLRENPRPPAGRAGISVRGWTANSRSAGLSRKRKNIGNPRTLDRGDSEISSSQSEFEITIHEGRKRQIRLMLEAVGHKVIYLKRISQGVLKLGNLKTGCWRILNTEEIAALKNDNHHQSFQKF